ncbi:MAG TPA: outer membrane protein assembly factor BamD, partial [Polyangiales bacterium]|nr:outer membrane protein assembly factor BamD [Polyangiales bacterium]
MQHKRPSCVGISVALCAWALPLALSAQAEPTPAPPKAAAPAPGLVPPKAAGSAPSPAAATTQPTAAARGAASNAAGAAQSPAAAAAQPLAAATAQPPAAATAQQAAARGAAPNAGGAAQSPVAAGVPPSAAARSASPKPGGAAQPSAGTSDPRSARAYFKAFAAKRLISVQLAEVRELREQLSEAETLAQAGRTTEAALLLTELTEHPRFADYADLTEFSAAHYALGSAQWRLGAAPSAQTSLRFVLARGPEDPYFLPAFRRYVDVALAERQLAPALETLSQYEGAQLPEDARAELNYLHARERLQANDYAEAKASFEKLNPHSRFYASAQFELGALAADSRNFPEAQAHFCRVTSVRDDSMQALLSDVRYYTVKDLSRLGEGRVAHEQRTGRQAADHYFQIPNDSKHLPEALFEAAYARYEAGDPDSALDLLDQLEARFPRSPHADEASLLRGYVALARCDYLKAEAHFAKFEARFAPVVNYLDRTLKNPARREAIYQALLRETQKQPSQQADPALRTIIGLLGDDEHFRDLHERVRNLDQQAASASRTPESFELLKARYLHGDKPLAATPDNIASDQDNEPSLEQLKQTSEDTRQALFALNDQVDTMRSMGAKPSDLRDLERTLSQLSQRHNKQKAALDAASLELAINE